MPDALSGVQAARRVLVISDTHGLLRPEVLALVPDADVILHAGDVGRAAVLDDLRAATHAPVYAVRGNVDRAPPLSGLPHALTLELGGVMVHVLHDLHDLDLHPADAVSRVVVSGHTHTPRLGEQGGVTYLNPGSVGPRRFSLPIACAWLHVNAGKVGVEPLILAP
ncbi:metallophosphoesterase family protein [Deinococcus sp.]|uniref:metallophosphoesterase family protein n=1 Tax=Deinococcus sp. TaxID=47478 RepID=UPI002869A15C|nr:metallophosphoesterase family protein [Deinococcus sp.]